MSHPSASATQAQKNKQRLGRWSLRGISLFFAATLWFYVLNSEPITVEKRLPIALETPQGVAVSNVVERDLSVKLNGPRAFIKTLFSPDQKVVIDLKNSNYQRGESFIYEINASDIPVPFGVDVLEISPDQLSIELQKQVTQSLPVKPELVGELPPELHIVHQEVNPAQVQVAGPTDLMKSLKNIKTQSLDISNLERSGSETLLINSLDPRLILKGKKKVNFEYEVRPRKANLTLKDVKIQFLTSTSNFVPKTKKVALDVLAPEENKSDIRQSQVKVTGEIPPDASGNIKVPLEVELPEGFFLLKIHPSSVEVKVEP